MERLEAGSTCPVAGRIPSESSYERMAPTPSKHMLPTYAVQRQGLDPDGPLFKAVSGELSNLRQGGWGHGCMATGLHGCMVAWATRATRAMLSTVTCLSRGMGSYGAPTPFHPSLTFEATCTTPQV